MPDVYLGPILVYVGEASWDTPNSVGFRILLNLSLHILDTCPAMISCRMPIIPSYRSCKPSQYMAITGAGIAGVKMVKKGW